MTALYNPADEPQKTSHPTATFLNEGDGFDFGIVNITDYQQRDDKTGDPLTWKDGTPRMGKILTILVTRLHGTACKGGRSNAETAAEGDTLNIWFEGSKWFPWKNGTADYATKNPGRPLAVGDVGRMMRGPDGERRQATFSPPQSFTLALRPFDPAKDGDLKARCEAAYHLESSITIDTPTPAAPAAAGSDMDDF